MAVAIFSLWIVGLGALWLVVRTAGVAPEFWIMAQGLTTMATMTAILSGSIIGYRQLSLATSSRHMAVADRLFAELNSPDNIEGRRRVQIRLVLPEVFQQRCAASAGSTG